MSPSERMKPVRRVAENKERNAAKILGDVQRYLKDQESKLEQLRLFQREYRERFDAAARGGMGARELQEYQAFMARLQQAIDQQEAAVEACLADRSLKKRNWQKKHTHTQAIGKVIERYKKEEVRAEEKQEQKESDEYGLRGAQRKS